jgi:hypothetical protein
MTPYDIQIELWKLRRQLDAGIISIREFLRQASELQKQQDNKQD